MLKATARRLCRSAARALPYGAQRAVIEGLPLAQVTDYVFSAMGPWRVAQLAAGPAGITGFRVSGVDGHIAGPVFDEVALPYYVQHGRWAARTNELLRTFFAERRYGTYVDVGANLGLTTIPVAQQESVHCIAIEADPSNVTFLRANIAANCPHQNVTIHHCAVYSTESTVTLEQSPDNPGDNRVRNARSPALMREDDWRTTIVQARPLDSIVRGVEGPLAIKIDVQGAEPYVVAGGQRTLGMADLLIIEWAPYWLRRCGGDPEVVTSWLSERYSTLRVADREDAPISEPVPTAQVVEHLRHTLLDDSSDPARFMDVIAQR